MAKKINLDIEKLKRLNDEGMTITEIKLHFGVSDDLIRNYFKLHNLTPNRKKRKWSEDEKLKISERRKSFLKENPDKHPWRSRDKFKSVPCEKVKNFLNNLGVKFIEEYDPNIYNRAFSIDIAMPDKLIALEINGNQHYESDGSLKPYYQERHNLLESNGWTVYEIHYSACFNLDKWESFVDKLKLSDKRVNFDYFTYTPKEIKKWICSDCSCDVSRGSIRCKPCYYISRTK